MNMLPHAVNINEFEYFEGVEFTVASGRDRVDLLIGQSNKSLLTVLEKRQGAGSEKPNFVWEMWPVTAGYSYNRPTDTILTTH